MKRNDWKERLDIVYSTRPNFNYETANDKEVLTTLAFGKQNLRIWLDKKNRGGKIVTLVSGFMGTEEDLKKLGKLLKVKCGVGGAIKNGEIIIQGDFRQRVSELLKKEGYDKTKIAG
ncbi:hypothetical protein EZS27_006352 [termite gut metagenome]|uniref:SUI1 domain-containing protein n=1 Tax=termite gut metagenome TaxID=433724 RepID=A0A5J4SLK4_9ZZZZ